MVVQFAMVGAVATFFSAFSTATLSAIFTLSLVVAGHVSVGPGPLLVEGTATLVRPGREGRLRRASRTSRR